MYYLDANSYYAGKIVQYVIDNFPDRNTFRYGLSYDHANGWRDNQDIYEIDVIMEIVIEQLKKVIKDYKVEVSCHCLSYGWEIIVELGELQ